MTNVMFLKEANKNNQVKGRETIHPAVGEKVLLVEQTRTNHWIPAFAGMTISKKKKALINYLIRAFKLKSGSDVQGRTNVANGDGYPFVSDVLLFEYKYGHATKTKPRPNGRGF